MTDAASRAEIVEAYALATRHVEDHQPFEIVDAGYELDGDRLLLDVYDHEEELEYKAVWRHVEAELELLSPAMLDEKHVFRLQRWLEAYDGRGSAEWHRARLMDTALTNYDPT
jgi:hypothetical protein